MSVSQYSEMQDFLTDFRRTIDEASEQLLRLSEKKSEAARAAGKWSPKEIVGHLIDSAANNHLRFVRAQLSHDLVFAGYEQEEWVRVQRYNDEPWEQLVRLWHHYNLHLVHPIASIPDETLKQRRSKHSLDSIAWQTVPVNESATLEYFIRDYLAHMKNHLQQILVAS